MNGNEQEYDFASLARELDCDADDPRVAEVLKAMAGQPPQPHEAPKDERPKRRPKKVGLTDS